jgi:carbon-monoxide dehydrogenase medium subunit
MPPHLISLEAVPDLYAMQRDLQQYRIGSGVALADCLRNSTTPALLKEACRNIAAPSIRNVGTIGGNVMSGVGDSIPALLASDASLVWFDGQNRVVQTVEAWLLQRRAEPLSKEHRLLLEVRIPTDVTEAVEAVESVESNRAETAAQAGEAAAGYSVVHFYEKLGRREAFCPSVVTIAGELHISADDSISSIRLAAGSAAAIAVRLTDAEAALQGQRLSTELIHYIHPLIREQFDGGTDAFASNVYRRQAAANMIAAALWSRIIGQNR